MKKLIVVLSVLAVLAGAACAYWFGYQWYLERGWRQAAEQIEAKYPTVDIVTLMPERGRQFTVTVDVLHRTASLDRKSSEPYVLAAVAFAGDEPLDNAETVALLNDILEQARAIMGRNCKVVIGIVVGREDGRWAVVWALEFYTYEHVTEPDLFSGAPVWGIPLHEDLVLFPGRKE